MVLRWELLSSGEVRPGVPQVVVSLPGQFAEWRILLRDYVEEGEEIFRLLSTGDSGAAYDHHLSTAQIAASGLVSGASAGGLGGSAGQSNNYPELDPVRAGEMLLKKGSEGDEVEALQRALNDLAGEGLSEDGIFGKLTKAAVKDFQEAESLGVDGIVGPKTMAAIDGRQGPSAPPESEGVVADVIRRVPEGLELLFRRVPMGVSYDLRRDQLSSGHSSFGFQASRAYHARLDTELGTDAFLATSNTPSVELDASPAPTDTGLVSEGFPDQPVPTHPNLLVEVYKLVAGQEVPQANVQVEAYRVETGDYQVWLTNEEGVAAFELPKGKDYAVRTMHPWHQSKVATDLELLIAIPKTVKLVLDDHLLAGMSDYVRVGAGASRFSLTLIDYHVGSATPRDEHKFALGRFKEELIWEAMRRKWWGGRSQAKNDQGDPRKHTPSYWTNASHFPNYWELIESIDGWASIEGFPVFDNTKLSTDRASVVVETIKSKKTISPEPGASEEERRKIGLEQVWEDKEDQQLPIRSQGRGIRLHFPFPFKLHRRVEINAQPLPLPLTTVAKLSFETRFAAAVGIGAGSSEEESLHAIANLAEVVHVPFGGFVRAIVQVRVSEGVYGVEYRLAPLDLTGSPVALVSHEGNPEEHTFEIVPSVFEEDGEPFQELVLIFQANAVGRKKLSIPIQYKYDADSSNQYFDLGDHSGPKLELEVDVAEPPILLRLENYLPRVQEKNGGDFLIPQTDEAVVSKTSFWKGQDAELVRRADGTWELSEPDETDADAPWYHLRRGEVTLGYLHVAGVNHPIPGVEIESELVFEGFLGQFTNDLVGVDPNRLLRDRSPSEEGDHSWQTSTADGVTYAPPNPGPSIARLSFIPRAPEIWTLSFTLRDAAQNELHRFFTVRVVPGAGFVVDPRLKAASLAFDPRMDAPDPTVLDGIRAVDGFLNSPEFILISNIGLELIGIFAEVFAAMISGALIIVGMIVGVFLGFVDLANPGSLSEAEKQSIKDAWSFAYALALGIVDVLYFGQHVLEGNGIDTIKRFRGGGYQWSNRVDPEGANGRHHMLPGVLAYDAEVEAWNAAYSVGRALGQRPSGSASGDVTDQDLEARMATLRERLGESTFPRPYQILRKLWEGGEPIHDANGDPTDEVTPSFGSMFIDALKASAEKNGEELSDEGLELYEMMFEPPAEKLSQYMWAYYPHESHYPAGSLETLDE